MQNPSETTGNGLVRMDRQIIDAAIEKYSKRISEVIGVSKTFVIDQRINDIFGAVGPQPSERLSVVALARLPKLIVRAKRILDSNRAVLNEFLESREELQVVRTDSGTTSFPRLLKGRVEDLYALLHEKYDTAIVPGRFFESPQHFRIGMCCQPELFKIGVERLGQALDELRA